mgnify:CR=1 FL=1
MSEENKWGTDLPDEDKNASAGLTNMGALKVPETMKPYIERFDIYMGEAKC